MKKTLKRAMLVSVVIMAFVLMMSFASSAASDCGTGNHNLIELEGQKATCTEPGYTVSYCTLCERVVGTTITENALGHDYKGAEYEYEQVGSYYKRGLTCQREDCGETVYDTHLDENNMSAFDRYYLVELVNPFVADTYCADVTYTKVIESHKEEVISKKKDAEYGKWYIKEGETLESYAQGLGYADYEAWMAAVDNENFVQRFKDKAFGAYDLIGWTESKMESGLFDEEDLVDFAATKVTANDKIYAAFEGDPNVNYLVQFMNANGAYFTTQFNVRHGQKADDSIFKPVVEDGEVVYTGGQLVLPETMKSYYEFKGWNYDINNVYGNVTFTAVYDEFNKVYEYQLKTWDDDKEEFVISDATATAVCGMSLEYTLPEGKTINDITARPKDRTYLYSWNGNWMTEDGLGFNSKNTQPPYGSLDTRYKDTEGYAPIVLTPTYNKNYNLYETTIVIKFANTVQFDNEIYERNRYLNNLNVQITDANGQLMTRGTANLVEGTDYAEFTCVLYDSTSYTVTVTSERNKYSGATVLSRNYVYAYDAPVYISVALTLDEDYVEGQSCRCICHNSLFKPIWVKILNLLYNLFNVKYVCCDDMYASIGDLLAYVK